MGEYIEEINPNNKIYYYKDNNQTFKEVPGNKLYTKTYTTPPTPIDNDLPDDDISKYERIPYPIVNNEYFYTVTSEYGTDIFKKGILTDIKTKQYGPNDYGRVYIIDGKEEYAVYKLKTDRPPDDDISKYERIPYPIVNNEYFYTVKSEYGTDIFKKGILTDIKTKQYGYNDYGRVYIIDGKEEYAVYKLKTDRPPDEDISKYKVVPNPIVNNEYFYTVKSEYDTDIFKKGILTDIKTKYYGYNDYDRVYIIDGKEIPKVYTKLQNGGKISKKTRKNRKHRKTKKYSKNKYYSP